MRCQRWAPAMLYPSYAERPPKLIAGSLVLDFLNTVEWRGDRTEAGERLLNYGELVLWSLAAGTIDAATAKALSAQARRDAEGAAQALGLALALRAELDAAFGFAAKPSRRLPLLDDLLRDAPAIGHLAHRQGRTIWTTGRSPDLRLPLVPIAISAASLLVAKERAQAKSCGDTRCGWVFLDETPRQTRVWCSMEGCGNRAKARAHYARRRT